jgi:hypothetical protein
VRSGPKSIAVKVLVIVFIVILFLESNMTFFIVLE